MDSDTSTGWMDEQRKGRNGLSTSSFDIAITYVYDIEPIIL